MFYTIHIYRQRFEKTPLWGVPFQMFGGNLVANLNGVPFQMRNGVKKDNRIS
jgi:hypothetical protein